MGCCISSESVLVTPSETDTGTNAPFETFVRVLAPPPASKRAIRQLPIVKVTPEDLVDENNRECCICLEPNNLHDKVMRLPCAHIFHCECVSEWLTKSCTCPICRYELQTDDPSYEKGRLERMKHRKPRYAQYELERMRIRDLSALCSRLKIPIGNIIEKPSLIRTILDSGKVDRITAPKPVEYKLSELKQMRVGKLKRAMADAGVFFDAKDVIEKEDMVMIFVNSGRVALLTEEDSDSLNVDIEKDFNETEPFLNTNNFDKFMDSDIMRTSAQSETINMKDTKSPQQFDGVGEKTHDFDSTKLHSSRIASYNPDESFNNNSAFTKRSIAELRRLAFELKVDVSDCIEKRDLIERLIANV